MAMCCKGGKCGRGRRQAIASRESRWCRSRASQGVERDPPLEPSWSRLRGRHRGYRYCGRRAIRHRPLPPRAVRHRLSRRPASMLLSHSYYITPRAAGKLLKVTKDFCNEVGQDYSIQKLCVQRRVQCELPPRGLLPAPSVGTQGWGLFAQNNRAVPSYNLLLNNAGAQLELERRGGRALHASPEMLTAPAPWLQVGRFSSGAYATCGKLTVANYRNKLGCGVATSTGRLSRDCPCPKSSLRRYPLGPRSASRSRSASREMPGDKDTLRWPAYSTPVSGFSFTARRCRPEVADLQGLRSSLI